MLIALFALLALVYTTINVLLIALRNYKAHQFFKKQAPKLSTVSEHIRPNIFAGHLFSVIFRDKNTRTISELHEKYGKTFGYYMCDQPWVSTKDLDLLKHLKIDEPHKHTNHFDIHLPFKEFNNSILQLKDEAWRRTRRAVAPALTNRKVRSEGVTRDIECVLEQLQAGIESRLAPIKATDGASSKNVQKGDARSMTLDAGDMFQRYTLGVIFSLTYRREREIDFYAARDAWVERLQESARAIKNPFVAVSLMFPFARPLISFCAMTFHPIGKLLAQICGFIIEATDIHKVARKKHQGFSQQIANGEHKEKEQQNQVNGFFKRRLIDTFIDALVEKRVGWNEFMGTAVILLVAGFETTASTITCLVWHLARNQRVQDKLRAAILKSGIDSEYLHWCVQETVRYHPAVPLGTGRILGENVNLNGLFLPKGTFVMSSIYSIHHDAEIWPQPEEFKPERWRDSANFHPAAFMGFGLGPRNCVGSKLAVHEIKLVIEMLLKRYKIETCQETPGEYAFSSPGLVYTNLDAPIKVRLVELS